MELDGKEVADLADLKKPEKMNELVALIDDLRYAADDPSTPPDEIQPKHQALAKVYEATAGMQPEYSREGRRTPQSRAERSRDEQAHRPSGKTGSA